jgi:hypothetical protein
VSMEFSHLSRTNRMSGFVANELSAFSVLQVSLIFEQEMSGGRSPSSMVFGVTPSGRLF